jgi:hypothetical protein
MVNIIVLLQTLLIFRVPCSVHAKPGGDFCSMDELNKAIGIFGVSVQVRVGF